MKRQIISSIVLSLTVATAVLPALANPIAPSSRNARDNRAMCNDVNVGYAVDKNIHQQNNIHATKQNDILQASNAYEYLNTSSGYQNTSVSGGVSSWFGGASAAGSTATGFSDSIYGKGSSNVFIDRSRQEYHDTSSFSDTTKIRPVVGQDCSAVVQSQTSIVNHLLSW
jgi:hypothetical protein